MLSFSLPLLLEQTLQSAREDEEDRKPLKLKIDQAVWEGVVGGTVASPWDCWWAFTALILEEPEPPVATSSSAPSPPSDHLKTRFLVRETKGDAELKFKLFISTPQGDGKKLHYIWAGHENVIMLLCSCVWLLRGRHSGASPVDVAIPKRLTWSLVFEVEEDYLDSWCQSNQH